jgi:hypothetical protein
VGTTFRKLAEQTETGNAWGDWDPSIFTVEDAAFGYITMKNGALILLESSWALNTLDVKEAKTTLCGTLGGADMEDGLRINKAWMGAVTTVKPSQGKGSTFTTRVTCLLPSGRPRCGSTRCATTKTCSSNPGRHCRNRDSRSDLRVRPHRKTGLFRVNKGTGHPATHC